MSKGGKAALQTNAKQGGDSRAGRVRPAAEPQAPATSLVPQERQAAPSPESLATASPQRPAPERTPEPGISSGASNGRQIALERRRDAARRGKKALKGANARAEGMARMGSARSRQLEALARSQNVDCSNMSGREICRLRRHALANEGKAAVASETRRQDLLKGRAASPASRPGNGRSAPAVEERVAEEAVEAGFQALCDQVESTPADAGGVTEPLVSSVRALCMARREAMAHRGKRGLRQRRNGGGFGRGVMPQEGTWKAAQRKGYSTREIARQRREELCQIGRGSSEPARPCGRPKVESAAPVKVEESETLSGGRVTGTQVQRAAAVTGTEAGSCSAITGTEYLSLEHYDRYCGQRPVGGPGKVGQSHTASGQAVSGTEVGRSPRVTGDEAGTCGAVTGTEYLASEQFEGFCGTRPEVGPRKVNAMPTRGGEVVSGTSVGRSPVVTGDESGSCRSITGTEYLNEAASEVPCGTPSADGVPKVGVMHTLKGRELTGTEVGRSVHVTGDEYGSCKPVTGTEYLGQEQFDSFCGSQPAATPEKVHELRTLGDQTITGTAIGRSPRVTGDENGSCGHLTGTPYYNKADFGELCREPAAGGVPKVGVMHTLRGKEVSGTQVGRSFNVTGDEYGGCKPITGTEYVGSDHYQAFCGSSPEAPPGKVTVGRTWNQQSVSGTPVGRSSRVTGDEYGACKPVSGTPYIGPDQYDAFCEAPETDVAGQRVADRHATPGHPVSGSQPGYDERVTGTERGACQNVSGAPYVGSDEFGQACPPDASGLHPRFRPEGMQPAAAAPASRPMPNGGFSVETPARTAQQRRERRVTGTAYGSASGITGPINKAMGLVSGTEEFRYRDQRDQPVVAEAEGPVSAADRVTVNGSSNGVTITGDDWQRGNNITGTEGFSTRRNLTQRGNPRGEGRSAYVNRELERKDVPPSRITGSSGNSDAGSLVTLSGGARG
ncbi:CsoS2 family carboxysome shell protein [Methylonatrum kenyense]|uniref:CsoS2 family carboxysome shell protein n=1 Tax=Methylonatrum kenyense TaxID=455253 RepID=UPI0020BE89CF|nr:CsoS2 family carboxysome shell protein [Methylonatrum kenyense]MCK8515632.1 CsoS2 family carboxysome shell protein [Methylonatrum kenyense]